MGKAFESGIVPFDESGLIEELLLALVGIHGDLFVDSSDIDRDDEKEEESWNLPGPSHCTVTISPELTWISEADRAVLGDLLRLGFHFKAVAAFVEREQSPWDPRHATRSPSVYRRALASGLTEMLDDYRCTVLTLQQELRLEAAPVLSTIKHRLWEYMDVLPALHALAAAQDEVSFNRLFPAADLINRLAAGTRSGLPAVRQALGRLLWHCNQVLMQQLAAWMLHGMLQDPNQEFFIQPRAQPPPPAAAATQQPQPQPQPQQQTQAQGGPQQQATREEDSAGASTSGRGADDEAAYREWHAGFQVNPRCLPLYVSGDLADTILFVGRAVRVLRRPGQGGGAGGGGGGGGAGAELLPLQDMMKFGQAFTALQSEPELSAPRLTMLVEGLRSHVARLLWRLLVGRAGLLPALAALKDYFLLGRGDFWQAFLAEARPLMAAPPRPGSVDADLALPFTRSAAKSSAEGDPLLAAFQLRYLGGKAEAEAAFTVKHSSAAHSQVPELDRAWDPLVLEVGLEWPLGLLLGREQLRRYNQLFALLLRLRRMQNQLDDAWKDLRVMDREMQRGTAPPVPHNRMRDLQDLRNHMAFVVSNLQIYIQTDVIEVNFSALENKIANCQDFSELERAHALFLNTLMVQSFLTVRTMCINLTEIFQDVAMLTQLVSRACCDPARLDFAAVSRLRSSFERHFLTLFGSISSQRMVESFRAPHLAQLVLRLNYNSFYSAKDMDAGGGRASVGVGTAGGRP
ncbi:hypothetical protein CHLRE_01g019150v5 [Chlamydomonas reinhardtii]|uniref:Gamma-tubulin complex component n=1 Tax=Chlamydomonas reinhardtii TaxID=3055 RepID=A0A2K3E647_CHLRE|nr:uncharacterized protein CHLRE_01g019150v5 [Chlamydomonas reinhardtii]PNW88207.1 hypothetical protein CHLRE_01g019150v5 [Chlamydomonas reinhardtii]